MFAVKPFYDQELFEQTDKTCDDHAHQECVYSSKDLNTSHDTSLAQHRSIQYDVKEIFRMFQVPSDSCHVRTGKCIDK